MIDRRTFLARSSVATALAAVEMQGGANASPLALPATIALPVDVVEPDVLKRESFSGSWMSFDRMNNCIITNRIELWATADACGMTAASLIGDDVGQRIESEDPKIAWAFTCMMRLMRSQSTPSPQPPAAGHQPKRPPGQQRFVTCPTCNGSGRENGRRCSECDGNRRIEV